MLLLCYGLKVRLAIAKSYFSIYFHGCVEITKDKSWFEGKQDEQKNVGMISG